MAPRAAHDRTSDPEDHGAEPAVTGDDGGVLVAPWWVGLDTLAAVAAFVVLFRVGGLGPAIAAITVVSVASGFLRVRHGVTIGKLLPLVTVCVIVRGVVGIVTDNDDVYFGIGIGYKYAIAVALVLSVVFRSSLAADYVARTLGLPQTVRCHDAYRSAIGRIVVAFGVLLALAACFDIWFLSVTDPDEYVLFRYLINWPLYTAFTAVSLMFLARRLAGVPDFPGILVHLEQQSELRAAERKRRRRR